MKDSITIYTDGACSKKHGLGAFGIWVPEQDFKTVLTVGGITNNFAELAAFIIALKRGLDFVTTMNNFGVDHESKKQVTIVSDSLYVLDGYNKYMDNWPDRATRINGELWELIHILKHEKGADFTTRHVRGHGRGENDAPEDVKGNDIIDKLVSKAVQL